MLPGTTVQKPFTAEDASTQKKDRLRLCVFCGLCGETLLDSKNTSL